MQQRNLFLTKTTLAALIPLLTAIISIIYSISDGNKVSEEQTLALVTSVVSYIAVCNAKCDSNKNIIESANKGEPIGLVFTPKGLPGRDELPEDVLERLAAYKKVNKNNE